MYTHTHTYITVTDQFFTAGLITLVSVPQSPAGHSGSIISQCNAD